MPRRRRGCETRAGRALPISISLALVDREGRTPSGETIDDFLPLLRAAKPFSVGLNCSLGSSAMRPFLSKLRALVDGVVSVHPSAGLPDPEGRYGETPELFAAAVSELARDGLAGIVGGCCGTTPAHLRLLGERVRGSSRPAEGFRVASGRRYAPLEMKLVKVAAAALNQTPLDWDGNKQNILAAIWAARADGVSVLCLPELCITGCGCEDAFLSPATRETALDVLGEILPATEGIVVCLGLPLAFNKATFNAVCLVANGKLLGFSAKRALAGDGIHYEPRWFKPWPAGKRVLARIRGAEYPLGDVHFDCGGVRIGFEICEDAWIAERPGAELALDAVRRDLEPQREPFRVRQARRAAALGARGVARVRRLVRLQQPARERGGARHLRR